MQKAVSLVFTRPGEDTAENNREDVRYHILSILEQKSDESNNNSVITSINN
jgi:hypothetical protein